MNGMMDKVYYGNTVGEWLIALVIIAASFVVAKILYWLTSTVVKQVTKRTKTKLDDLLIDMVEEPLVFIVTVLGISYGLHTLTLSDTAQLWLSNGTQMIIVLAISWMVVRVLDALYEQYLVPLADSSENTLDDQLLPILRRASRFVVWSLGIVIALNNAGYDVAALLAGLGIGGLALAMAAKDTVSNIFGGFTIFTDKPFSLGDRVKIDGFDGTVKEIGLRSTRLKTLEGRIVTIPNARFAEAAVENVSLEPSRKVVLALGLTYDTKPEAMEQAMDILKSIAAETEGVDEGALVGFTGYGDFSMNITFIYYITSGADILGTQSKVNLAILRQFNEQGLEFAFPTQTIYQIPVTPTP